MTKLSQPELVSIIIAARDEADFIGDLITNIKESLSGFPKEIIVVDDGSRDETSQIAKTNGVILLSLGMNFGKGHAMVTGAQHASGNIIVFIDGDGVHDPKDIPKLIMPILEGKAELVIGSRALPRIISSRGPLIRRITNCLASLVLSVIISFPLPLATWFKCPMKWTQVTDCTSGFRAMRRTSWQKLSLISLGFQIETEMIYDAVKNRLTIAEVPISYNLNGHFSHLSIFRDGLNTLKLLGIKLLDDIRQR